MIKSQLILDGDAWCLSEMVYMTISKVSDLIL
jgi:hypothetical protein